MAKVSGPLFSMEASGAYGNALVFGRRKGANVVRQLVTPANPQTADQESAKNRIRVGGMLQTWARVTTLTGPTRTDTDKDLLAAAAPSNQTWNSYLVQAITGPGATRYIAAEAAYDALAAGEKTAWDTAALALTPPMAAVYQTAAGGVAGTNKTAGEAFFIHCYGLAAIGIGSTPGATPPTYS